MSTHSTDARSRLLTELCKRGGTCRELAERAGITADYADDLLRGMLARGEARRSRMPGTNAFLWEAVL